ncbi:MAG: TadE family protein [Planctomycetaceae bacterium]
MTRQARNQRRLSRFGTRAGTTAVELVCVLPVLVGLILGAADLGRSANYDNVLSNVARVGAEYGATHRRTRRNADQWEQRLIVAATEEAMHLPHFDASLLTLTVTTTTEADGRLRVQVTAAYPFETVVHWPGFPTDIPLASSVSFVEYR